jgi:hypothetical protein
MILFVFIPDILTATIKTIASFLLCDLRVRLIHPQIAQIDAIAINADLPVNNLH